MNNKINKTVTSLVAIIWLLVVHMCTSHLPYLVFAWSLVLPTVTYMIYLVIFPSGLKQSTRLGYDRFGPYLPRREKPLPEIEKDPKVITQLPVEWRLK